MADPDAHITEALSMLYSGWIPPLPTYTFCDFIVHNDTKETSLAEVLQRLAISPLL